MIKGGSIRGRLLRTQLLWSLLWGLAMTTAVWLAIQHEVDELLDDSLQSVAEGLIGPLVGPFAGAAPARAAAGAVVAAPHSDGPRFVWQRVGPGPTAPVLAAALNAPLSALQATPSAGFADLPGWRVYGKALGRDGRMLYVAQSGDERLEAKLELPFAALLAGVPMAGLALQWLNARVRHDLQPLQALSNRLAAYDPLRPGATLGPAEHEELQAVHAAIDALAARLTQRIAHERAFTAHAAHALRTPLDLKALAARLPVEGLRVQVQAGVPLSADVDLVSAALLNLFDNAVNNGGHVVTLSTPEAGLLCVRDDGRGIGSERRRNLQRALDEQDYEGRVGLGLMLADLVARAHGGALTLPAGDTGFTALLRLQASAAGDNPAKPASN